ncbi:MAG: MBL fold metallo-hydrolase [Oscillospiraceae bacterium]
MKCLHFKGGFPYCTNCFLLISDAKTAVAIDPAADIKYYDDALTQYGANLSAIFLTHGHNDHTGTVKELVKKYSPKVYIEKSDSVLFNIKADEFFVDDEKINFDEMTFEITTTPGHTPGSVCIKIEDMLFTGDTLFDGDTGRTDLKGGDSEAMRNSIIKLCRKITDNPQIYPGHEEFSDMDTQKKYNSYICLLGEF